MAEADAALPGDILVVDYIYVVTLLICEDRGTWYGDDQFRGDGFKKNGGELVGN